MDPSHRLPLRPKPADPSPFASSYYYDSLSPSASLPHPPSTVRGNRCNKFPASMVGSTGVYALCSCIDCRVPHALSPRFPLPCLLPVAPPKLTVLLHKVQPLEGRAGAVAVSTRVRMSDCRRVHARLASCKPPRCAALSDRNTNFSTMPKELANGRDYLPHTAGWHLCGFAILVLSELIMYNVFTHAHSPVRTHHPPVYST